MVEPRSSADARGASEVSNVGGCSRCLFRAGLFVDPCSRLTRSTQVHVAVLRIEQLFNTHCSVIGISTGGGAWTGASPGAQVDQSMQVITVLRKAYSSHPNPSRHKKYHHRLVVQVSNYRVTSTRTPHPPQVFVVVGFRLQPKSGAH